VSLRSLTTDNTSHIKAAESVFVEKLLKCVKIKRNAQNINLQNSSTKPPSGVTESEPPWLARPLRLRLQSVPKAIFLQAAEFSG
jgi:hypothetical protein